MKKLFVLMLIATSVFAQTKTFTIYYPTWYFTSIPPDSIDYTRMTHIVLFDNGNVTKTAPYWAYMFAGTGYPSNGGVQAGRPTDTETDSIEIHYHGISDPKCGAACWPRYLDSLLAKAHRNGVKVVITIQAVSGTRNCLTYVMQDSARSQTFVDASVSWAERKHFDGVELDYETWGSTGDYGALATATELNRFVRILNRRVKSMSTGLGQTGEILASVQTDHYNYYYPSQSNLIDQYLMQMYNYGECWWGYRGSNITWFIAPLHLGTLPNNQGYTIEASAYDQRGPLQWIAAGFNAAQLGMGMPSYTIGYIGSEVQDLFQTYTRYTQMGSYASYRDLLQHGGTEYWDEGRKSNYIHGTSNKNYSESSGWFVINSGEEFRASSETPTSLGYKIQWGDSIGIKHFMMYDYGSDMMSGVPVGAVGKHPLHEAVWNAMQGSGASNKTHYLRRRK